MMDQSEHSDSNTDVVGASSGGEVAAGDAPAMTASLMAKLFGVPLLIICLIVGCSVTVVLLFGSLATDRQRSVDGLLTVLETSTGERTVGVLLPKEKELWQVGRELALRLDKKETELTTDELETVVHRLLGLLSRDSARSADLSKMGRKRMHYVMQALARTDAAEAVDPLGEMLSDTSAETRRVALVALAKLGEHTSIRSAMKPMAAVLRDDPDATVRMIACVSLSSVATRADLDVIDAMERAYLDSDRDVKWNAALALARLGDVKGRSLLLDMLDRSYWEKDVRVRIASNSGTMADYPMPPQAVNRYLVAAVDASASVDDEEVWDRIGRLQSDAAPEVVAEVREVLSRRAVRESSKQGEGT